MTVKKPLWRRILRIAGTAAYLLVVLTILLYAVLTKSNPKLSNKLFPYHFYTVVTDSMVPTIPVDSLVVTKRVTPEALTPGTIITFQANRFGDDIVLTHYLDSIEEYEGEARYRTHAEGTDYKDDYVTRYDDIVGIYVAHVPGLGKLPLFLTSSYGLSMLGLIALILIVNGVLQSKVDKEGFLENKGFVFKSLRLTADGTVCRFHGQIRNTTVNAVIHKLDARLRLYDKQGNLLTEQTLPILQADGNDTGVLEPKQALWFYWNGEEAYPAKHYQVVVLESGMSYQGFSVSNLSGSMRKKLEKKQRLLPENSLPNVSEKKPDAEKIDEPNKE